MITVLWTQQTSRKYSNLLVEYTLTFTKVIKWTRLSGWDEGFPGVIGIYPRFSHPPRGPSERLNRMGTRYKANLLQWPAKMVTLVNDGLAAYGALLANIFLECHLNRFRNQ